MLFLLSEASSRLKGNNLIEISRLIDWCCVEKELGDLGRSGYGPEGYDPIKMLKALILQAWHSLSDPGLEEAVRVRLDFLIITGLEKVPDETTFCRFRNLLIKRGLLEKILNGINSQLSLRGLKIEKSAGAILDATIIASSSRPKKESKAILVDRHEECEEGEHNEGNFYDLEEESYSKDPDARWLKKGKQSYFGYKGYILVDQDDGYIDKVYVTPANKSEVKELENIVKDIEPGQRLYADKGYASGTNSALLKDRRIKDGIMKKAARNRELNNWEKKFNRLISKIRYKVEQGFGTLKRKFSFARASYCTVDKVKGQMTLKAMAFNLLKALNKMICFQGI